jgi:hypothetical protein
VGAIESAQLVRPPSLARESAGDVLQRAGLRRAPKDPERVAHRGEPHASPGHDAARHSPGRGLERIRTQGGADLRAAALGGRGLEDRTPGDGADLVQAQDPPFRCSSAGDHRVSQLRTQAGPVSAARRTAVAGGIRARSEDPQWPLSPNAQAILPDHGPTKSSPSSREPAGDHRRTGPATASEYEGRQRGYASARALTLAGHPGGVLEDHRVGISAQESLGGGDRGVAAAEAQAGGLREVGASQLGDATRARGDGVQGHARSAATATGGERAEEQDAVRALLARAAEARRPHHPCVGELGGTGGVPGSTP